jgi:hypothetical protein
LVLSALATPALAQPRDLSGFDTVAAEGRFRVEIAVGPEYQVVTEGPDAARISTRLDGDTLEIKPARRSWFGGNPRYDALVRVTLPRLEGVSAARGAVVNATVGGECSEFEAASAMGAALTVAGIQCVSVDAAAAMGATLHLDGACETLDVSAAMGASVNAANLRCGVVDASAAMGGDVDAHATASYDASAAMGGDVQIAGAARAGDLSTAMGGSVTQRN